MTDTNTVKPTLIVTRHEHLVTVLRERGTVDDSTPVLSHVDAPEQVVGHHVCGVLPHHLSARAASVTEIPMRWRLEDREAMQRGDVDLDGTRRAAGDPISYVVLEIRGGGIDRERPRWLAVARAYEHVERYGQRYGQHFGSGPAALRFTQRLHRGLDVVVVGDGDGAQTACAEVIEARGVWRPDCRGQWLDGYGLPVEEASIAPASGWDDASACGSGPGSAGNVGRHVSWGSSRPLSLGRKDGKGEEIIDALQRVYGFFYERRLLVDVEMKFTAERVGLDVEHVRLCVAALLGCGWLVTLAASGGLAVERNLPLHVGDRRERWLEVSEKISTW